MRVLYIAAVLSLSIFGAARAAEQTPGIEADVKQLIAVSGGANLATQLAEGMAQAMFRALKKNNQKIPDQLGTVITSELTTYMREHMDGPGGFIENLVPVYTRNFTRQEIRQMIAFYKTPVGLKLLRVQPTVLQESMQAGQTWAEAQAPELEKRLKAAMIREGLIPPQPN